MRHYSVQIILGIKTGHVLEIIVTDKGRGGAKAVLI